MANLIPNHPSKLVKGDKLPGRGRPKGVPNRTTVLLKEALLVAAENAGREVATMAGEKFDPERDSGLVRYLTKQAHEEPVAFMNMLGKVLPLQLTGQGGGPLVITWQAPE